MSRQSIHSAAIALVCAALLCFNTGADRSAAQPTTDDARVEALLSALTLEQKIAQLFMVTLHGAVMTEAGADFLRTFQPGAVSLFTANISDPAGTAALTNDFQTTISAAGGLPLLIAIDQEGGLVSRLTRDAGFTVFPAPMVLAAAGPAMTQQVAAFTARQLRAVGIHMNLAPVADLETNPNNPIIFRRTFGSDPQFAAEAVAAYVEGLQAAGALATLKHFPGHGEAAQDSHAVLQALDLDRDRLNTVELVPFAAGIEAGAAAVMVAHIWYPAYDAERIPASLSANIIGGVLRGDLGFDGLVLTDALDMNAVDLEFPLAEAGARAIAAGVDMLALGPSSGLEAVQATFDAVLTAVQAGNIPVAQIDQSVRRILRAKLDYGILDAPLVSAVDAAAGVDAPGGERLTEALVSAAVTVAYDRGDRIPVAADVSAAVIFPGTHYEIQTECAADRADIRWLAVNASPTPSEIAGASRLAAEVETVIVWTENAIADPSQAALVNALPPDRTVAVALWSPYDWLRFPSVSAYVALYAPSRYAIPAACAVLFGGQPSTGRFPFALGPGLMAGMGE